MLNNAYAPSVGCRAQHIRHPSKPFGSSSCNSIKAMTATQLVEPALSPHQGQQEQDKRRLVVVTTRHHKVLHLIRHGEGFHNVAGRKDRNNYKSWEYQDAHLTDYGWQQAKAVQDHIRATGIKVEVVITSPLTRALETAVGCFGNLSKPLNGTQPLMLELTAKAGVRSAHPAVSADGCPPIICYELCREHLGVHPCDRRHPISSKAALFPGIDVSHIEQDHDHLWQEDHRETREEIQERGRKFMEQVMARPDTHIAVVSHSSFLHFLLSNYGSNASTTVQGDLHRWFENCELRSIVVVDEQSSSKRHDPLHFPGYSVPVKEGPEV